MPRPAVAELEERSADLDGPASKACARSSPLSYSVARVLGNSQNFDGMASTFASLLDPSLLDGRVAVCSPRRCYQLSSAVPFSCRGVESVSSRWRCLRCTAVQPSGLLSA